MVSNSKTQCNVLIVGLGHVGNLTRAAFDKSGCSVHGYDIAHGEPYPFDRASNADYVVICVNTPRGDGGAADLTQLREAVAQVPAGPHVVIRSTVPPGTCQTFADAYQRSLSFWPEYVGETTFLAQRWAEAHNTYVILGLMDGEDGQRFADLVTEIYGPEAPLHVLSLEEAECAKYMENTYFAVKVAFVNEWRRIVRRTGGNWHRVREAWLADSRISRDHSQAFQSFPGFAGKCLPKDLDALLHFSGAAGISTPVLVAARTSNLLSEEGNEPSVEPRR